MGETSTPRRAPAPAQIVKNNPDILQRTPKNTPPLSRSHGIEGQAARPVLKAHLPHARRGTRVNVPSSNTHLSSSARPQKRGLPDTTDLGSRKRPKIDAPASATAHPRPSGHGEPAKPAYLADKARPFAKTSAFDQYFRKAWVDAGKIRESENDEVKPSSSTARGGKPSNSRTEGGKSADPGAKAGKPSDARINGGKSSDSRIKGDRSVDSMIRGFKPVDLKTKGDNPGNSRLKGFKPSGPRTNGIKPNNSSSKGDKSVHSKAKVSKSRDTRTQGRMLSSWRANEGKLGDLKALIRSSIFNIPRPATKAGTNSGNPFRGRHTNTQVIKPPRVPSPPKRNPFFPFFRLPRELRDKIYGHLLHAPGPITVLKAWTQCYGRYRGGIEPAILCVNKQTAAEGAEVLYSTNTFSYLLRDNGVPVPQTTHHAGVNASTDRKRGATGRSRLIYLTKHARLIRRLELVVESNRSDADYGVAISKALVALRVAGVRPLELSFSLKPRLERRREHRSWTMVDFFSAGVAVMPALRALNFAKLRFDVLTPRGRRVEMVLDGQAIRDGFGVREKQAADRFQDPWAKDVQALEARARRAEESLLSFMALRMRIEQACEHTDFAIGKGWWKETEGEEGEDDDDSEKGEDGEDDEEVEDDEEDDEDRESEADSEDMEDGEDEKRDKVKKGPHYMANAQSVDASQERIRRFEESIRADIGPKKPRFWCVSRVKGAHRSYIA